MVVMADQMVGLVEMDLVEEVAEVEEVMDLVVDNMAV